MRGHDDARSAALEVGVPSARGINPEGDDWALTRSILDSWTGTGTERACVQTREWILTAAVIVVPLIIAIVVTLWSLEQVRYRPKKRRPGSAAVSGESEADGAASESAERGRQ